MDAAARRGDDRRGRPPTRDVAAVFGLGVAGALIPIVGWLVGAWLVVRASSWSAWEKLVGLVGPVVALLVAVGALAAASGANVRLPVLAAVPLTLSVASAIGAVYLALRLVAHRRDAARTDP